jgi:hypothetical protein
MIKAAFVTSSLPHKTSLLQHNILSLHPILIYPLQLASYMRFAATIIFAHLLAFFNSTNRDFALAAPLSAMA